jgi:tetratricopeptide (TPR) repeat protein
MYSLALTHRAQGRATEAEALLVRVVAILEKRLGKDHHNLAAALNNLGGLYAETRRFAKAAPPLQRAIEIGEKTFGPNDPELATALYNMAWVYEAQGQPALAEPLIRRSIAIRENVFGSEHPSIAQCLAVYANILRKTRRRDEAGLAESRARKIYSNAMRGGGK